MKRAVVCLVSLMAWCARAEAQGPTAAPSPPPPSPSPWPTPTLPPATLPPPPPGYMYVPGPSAADLDALERSGRRHKNAGIALMATGGGLLATGLALVIAGSVTDATSCTWGHSGYYYYSYTVDYHNNFATCWNDYTVAGAWVAVFGSIALVTGVPFYQDGLDRIHRARALRRRLVVPSVKASPQGVGVSLSAAF